MHRICIKLVMMSTRLQNACANLK